MHLIREYFATFRLAFFGPRTFRDIETAITALVEQLRDLAVDKTLECHLHAKAAEELNDMSMAAAEDATHADGLAANIADHLASVVAEEEAAAKAGMATEKPSHHLT
jgi:hypothetical protein